MTVTLTFTLTFDGYNNRTRFFRTERKSSILYSRSQWNGFAPIGYAVYKRFYARGYYRLYPRCAYSTLLNCFDPVMISSSLLLTDNLAQPSNDA